MSIIIKNATIITQNDQREIIKGDIRIDGNSISEIGEKIESNNPEYLIDATGKIAIPGLINAHTHVGMTIFRGYGEDLPLHRWLEEKIWPIEARQTAKDAGIAARLSFCEMIKSGTTSFAEMCLHDTHGIFSAANEVGMRGIISRGIMDFNHPQWIPKIMREIESSLQYSGDTLLPSVSAHAPYTCSEELLLKTKELAKRKKLKYQIHVSETRKEIFEILNKTGKYPYEYLDSIGLMDSDSIFAHGGWLTKKEMVLAASRNLNVASCPISNMKLATGGICQISELDKAGATVTLGTDGAASNNSLNMFETMKMAALLQKHHYWKADVISNQRILDFATINGAKALGVNGGSLSKGKLADIVLLERGPNMFPEHDIVANIIYAAGPQNVSDVIINGKVVMQERKILTVNEGEVIRAADELAKEILSR